MDVGPIRDFYQQNREAWWLGLCHSERSEESQHEGAQILRCAQNDTAWLARMGTDSSPSLLRASASCAQHDTVARCRFFPFVPQYAVTRLVQRAGACREGRQ